MTQSLNGFVIILSKSCIAMASAIKISNTITSPSSLLNVIVLTGIYQIKKCPETATRKYCRLSSMIGRDNSFYFCSESYTIVRRNKITLENKRDLAYPKAMALASHNHDLSSSV